MYQPRTRNYRKSDPEQRWNLPDRVFFACGACHVLAAAFMKRWVNPSLQAVWIRPVSPHIGNHIFVDGDEWVFDYHGYSNRQAFLDHTWKTARLQWPGWDATLVELSKSVLISSEMSRAYDGLWLREPAQFLHDAMPRAELFIERFGPPPTRPGE